MSSRGWIVKDSVTLSKGLNDMKRLTFHKQIMQIIIVRILELYYH